MDCFRTPVDVKPGEHLIGYHSRMLFMGSCFASNIGQYFANIGLNALVNPFGVLYNPFSIANSLERLIKDKQFTEDDVQNYNGLYHTFYHHSQFSAIEPDAFLKGINQSFEASRNFLKDTDVLILTFGTSWVYEHVEQGLIVSNCHKYPASTFKRYRLSVDEIVERFVRLIEGVREVNPDVRVMFTVSPVRHWKDGAHGNQLSKATLLLAIEQLIEKVDNCDYFPAYELLLDDLRDYRFFADDMLHPSEMAVAYIRQKFIEAQFDETAKTVLGQLLKLQQAVQHRPFNPSSSQHQAFIQKQIRKLKALQSQYQGLNLSPALDAFMQQVK
ncbi:GSCFA domain-containing protein [Carboxylicivirga taeanensis]|uniref:GSCFA domain-containing protein n=1 Tax=Carboxylicivirga taeanensis TaxID=1416875 RepID=UPI003F6DC71A